MSRIINNTMWVTAALVSLTHLVSASAAASDPLVDNAVISYGKYVACVREQVDCRTQLSDAKAACLSAEAHFPLDADVLEYCVQVYTMSNDLESARALATRGAVLPPGASPEAQRCFKAFTTPQTLWVETMPANGNVTYNGQEYASARRAISLSDHWYAESISVRFPADDDSSAPVVLTRSISEAFETNWRDSFCTMKALQIVKPPPPPPCRWTRDQCTTAYPSLQVSRPLCDNLYPCELRHEKPFLSYVGIAVGVTGLVSGTALGVGFGLAAHSNENQSNKQCGAAAGFSAPNACTSQGMALNRAAQSYEKAAYWSMGVGALATVVGAVLFIAAPDVGNGVQPPRTGANNLRLQPALSRAGSGLLLQGDW